MTKLTYSNYCAIVVDNASGDNSLANLREWAGLSDVPVTEYVYDSPAEGPRRISSRTPSSSGFRQLLLVGASYNTGFCKGNNIGMQLAQSAGADYLFILNNDTILEPGVLGPLVETAQSRPDAGLLSPLICYASERSRVWWGGGEFNKWLSPRYKLQGEDSSGVRDKITQETQWSTGCATFMPVATFKQFGGFDEAFFIWCDEWDLSLRVRKAGHKLLLVPSAVLYHKVGKSLGITSPLVYFYSQRNMLILRARYLGRLRWLTFLSAYLPFKLLQALFYSIKFDSGLFILAFFDIVRDGPGQGHGIWKRQQ